MLRLQIKNIFVIYNQIMLQHVLLIDRAIDLGKDWAHLRRMYAYVMTSNQKKMLRRHYDMLLGKEVQEKYNIDPELVLASTTLYELDEAYGR